MTKDEIKAIVSVPEVLERYGVKVKHGRCNGICHGGTDLNAKVSRDFYYCYVCGKGMDIFDLTMHFAQCDFRTAFELLGGTDKPSFKAKTLAEQAQRRARQRIETERIEKAELRRICDYITVYQNLIAESEPLSDEWCWYQNKLPYEYHKLECHMERK
ncbi:CHC2 zinc finger domain-containing protein [Parasporobacterium paucivorans]|uniref:Zinc finger CHC2-type domain-containing protein n=1 Tax=Parasporobacterium paucivorans DSM 15970 TaxID=1122934 RepID=A0A1M6B5X2_9FIRM|nr:CHC2 zinc finger domain-containing protein [Parasporobacterium paucivorans]SHI44116.1 hypothetical protein SAMN02745691_00268 [Parasporobacterium paucivorans DSM 15970]